MTLNMDIDKKDQNLNESKLEKKNPARYKYRIITKTPIGKGGFSIVYKAVDRFDNVYAIKCIPLEKIKHNTDKFLLELDISMKMKHQNIVKSFDIFKTNKNWYIVCEYCDNGTLSDIIKTMNMDYIERELNCKKYLTQLKNALKYLYRNNIVHRDLKPTNILISGKNSNETLKLADFGFSRYFSAEDNDPLIQQKNDFMMTSFCGTPMYMAPELLCNRKYTTKADLWSFGVIMYEMLYGVNPYNYPKSISNLLELMKTQEIVFKDVYSNECLSLMKSLLQIDVNKRINWENFFKHPWFDRKIKSGFSVDSLGIGSSSDNLVSPNFDQNDDISENFKVNNVSIKNMIQNEIKKHNDIDNDNDNDDFEVIDKDDIEIQDVDTYKEEESKGILTILSNSIYTLLGKKTSF